MTEKLRMEVDKEGKESNKYWIRILEIPAQYMKASKSGKCGSSQSLAMVIPMTYIQVCTIKTLQRNTTAFHIKTPV